MCSLNVPFQDSKVLSISFVAISSSFIGKHCESKSDTHNATHRKVNLPYTLLKLKAYNFSFTISKYLITENMSDLTKIFHSL